MKDIPVFTTQYGVASLILKEVPYRKEAYIILQDSLQPEELMKECIGFCLMVGAEKIYVRGHQWLERYPVHASIYEMRGAAQVDEAQVRCLWPVTPENIEQWRKLLNERMSGVDHAHTLERSDEKQILAQGGGYFVHQEGKLLGAGWIVEDEVRLLAACEKGAGEQVMHTLLSTVPDSQIRVQVVSTNERAIRLYERMGFVKCAELYRWHCVKNTEKN